MQISTFLFVQVPKPQVPIVALLHVPAVPPPQPKVLQVPTTRPLHAAPIGLPLQLPGSFLQGSTLALQTWFRKVPHVCPTTGPVCGHDGLVGSHQMTFSFS